MTNFKNQWIEIFRAGDYGDRGDWPVESLRKVVRNFAPETWRPPAVLGHPEHDSPAFGWVRQLKEEGGRLLARFQDVHPALEALVSEGRYPNRSAAFYLNPQGNGPVLRHVGFLGAQPPEVKGLAAVGFGEEAFVAFEPPSAASGPALRDPMRRTLSTMMREFLAERFGGSNPPVFTEQQVQERVAKAVGPLEQKIAQLAAEFRQERQQTAERGRDLDARQNRSRVAAFIERQRAANRWVPAFDRAGLPHLLDHLAAFEGVIEFTEGERKREVRPYELLVNFLEQIPAMVPTRELAKAARKAGRRIAFTEPGRRSGVQIDPASIQLAERVEALKPDLRAEFPQADATRIHALALDRARQQPRTGSGAAAGEV